MLNTFITTSINPCYTINNFLESLIISLVTVLKNNTEHIRYNYKFEKLSRR